MNLVNTVRELTHDYVRKGGKANRKQQRDRMLAFARHAQALGACEMGQVGARHVIRYWKDHRALSDATLLNHWYALCVLWKLSGKDGEPPKPWKNTPSIARPSLKDKLFGTASTAR